MTISELLKQLWPGYWFDSGHPEITGELISSYVGSCVTLFSVAAAAYLAYRYGRKQAALSRQIQIRAERLRREIDALETIWALLAYMSPRETRSSIIRWRKEKNDEHKTYYFHFPNLERFLLEETETAFYRRHAGLHLPATIREKLFKYCSMLMGLYLRHSNDKDLAKNPLILVENRQLVTELFDICEQLNLELKAILNKRYQQILDLENL